MNAWASANASCNRISWPFAGSGQRPRRRTRALSATSSRRRQRQGQAPQRRVDPGDLDGHVARDPRVDIRDAGDRPEPLGERIRGAFQADEHVAEPAAIVEGVACIRQGTQGAQGHHQRGHACRDDQRDRQDLTAALPHVAHQLQIECPQAHHQLSSDALRLWGRGDRADTAVSEVNDAVSHGADRDVVGDQNGRRADARVDVGQRLQNAGCRSCCRARRSARRRATLRAAWRRRAPLRPVAARRPKAAPGSGQRVPSGRRDRAPHPPTSAWPPSRSRARRSRAR